MKRRLSELTVSKMRPPATGRLEVWDTALPGFGIRISPAGGRSWVVAVRKPGAKHPSRVKLGEHPAMALKDARRAAVAILDDKAAAFAPAPGRDTVAAVAAEWLKRDQSKNRRADEAARILARDVLPAIGHLKMGDVRKRDLIALVDKIADRGSPIMANRALARVKRMFKWAAGRDIIESDPSAHVAKPAPEVCRDRVLDPDEIRAVWLACDDYPFGLGVRLLLLTAARRGEVFDLRRDELDLGAAVIRLPAARTKTAEARIIPLSGPAVEIIEQLPDLGGDYLLTFDGRRPYRAFWSAKLRLDARINLPPWRIHDLRRTAATGMQRLGVRLEAVEAVLGHTSGSRAGVIGVYQKHKFEAEARAAVEAWGREVERIVTGEPAQVVQLRR